MDNRIKELEQEIAELRQRQQALERQVGGLTRLLSEHTGGYCDLAEQPMARGQLLGMTVNRRS